MTGLVTRFAPSPSGRLHLGHAYSADIGWRAARDSGGRFLLRIEDIDAGRCRPEFEQAIYQDLAWLGIDWDPPVWRQSERMTYYAAALHRLRQMDLLYPCFCTRKDIQREIAAAGHAPHGPEGLIYPGTCDRLSEAERDRHLAAGVPYALRLRMEAAARRAGSLFFEEECSGRVTVDALPFGDVVLARKDTPTSYHLAVVVDDAAQQVTLVTRGRDLFHATHLQRVLQALLELPAPAYRHHALIADESGRRLAKRDRDMTIAALREAGLSPDDVRRLWENSNFLHETPAPDGQAC
jgi:glutamyl-Q tRNA(Asp) synthetase